MTLNDIEKSIQSEKIKVKKAMAHLLYSFIKLEKLKYNFPVPHFLSIILRNLKSVENVIN